MAEPSKQPSDPKQCTRGCGFFGNEQAGGMCSKCAREVAGSEAAAAAVVTQSMSSPKPPTPIATPAVTVAASAAVDVPEAIGVPSASCVPVLVSEPAAATAAAGGSDAPAKKKSPKKKNRCFLKECRAKLRMVEQQTGKCLCGHTFCSKHRHAEGHNCQGDHKTAARERIAKANEKVVNDKVLNRI